MEDTSARSDAVEYRGLQDVGAGVDLIRRRLVTRWLLDERGHPPVVVGRYDAEGRGVGYRVQRDGALRPFCRWKAMRELRSRSVRTSPLTTTKVSSTPP